MKVQYIHITLTATGSKHTTLQETLRYALDYLQEKFYTHKQHNQRLITVVHLQVFIVNWHFFFANARLNIALEM